MNDEPVPAEPISLPERRMERTLAAAHTDVWRQVKAVMSDLNERPTFGRLSKDPLPPRGS